MAKGSLRVNGIIVDTDGEIKASTGDSIVIREDDGSAVITVDTNGKTSIGGPMDVGVDDTGHDVKFFGATSGSYMLWDESEDDLIIGGAGKIGIGTTTPDHPLEITHADTSNITGGNIADNSAVGLHIDKTGDNDGAGSVIKLSSNSDGCQSAIAHIQVDDNDADLAFYTDNAGTLTEAMRIDNSQNVGIGTTAPAKILDIVGSTNNGLLEGVQITNTDYGVGEAGQSIAINFKLSQAGTATKDAGRITVGKDDYWADNASADSHMTFKTRSNDTFTEHMRITSAGKVGIGTTNPYGALNVSDPTGTTTVIISDPTENDSGEHWYFRNTGGNFYIGQSTDGTGAWDSLAARMTFSDGGGVGIGAGVATQGALTVARSDFSSYSDAVTNPTGQALTIAADYTNGRYTGIYSVYTSSNNATKTKFAHWITTDTTNGITANWGTTSNYANGVTRNDLTIKYNGYVGIGSSSPAHPLDIAAAANLGLQVKNTNGAYVRLMPDSTGANADIRFDFEGGSGSETGVALIFRNGTTQQMRLQGAGNVYMYSLSTTSTLGAANMYIHSDGELYRVISSRRFKTNIVDTKKGLFELSKLRPVDYNSNLPNDDSNKLCTGLIAEEVAEAGFEEYVTRDSENVIESVSYPSMVTLCIKAIQELSAKVKTLEDAG